MSVQEQESKKAEYNSAVARYNAAVADANVNQSQVNQLTAFEDFKRIVAPFDGIVTARNTDVGALINAGSGAAAATGRSCFALPTCMRCGSSSRCRRRCRPTVHNGLTADLTLPQYPDKTFKAVVATTSEAINKTSRTLLVELHADNVDNLLQPGTFAEVHFNLASNPGTIRIPTSALIFREDGVQVAVLGAGNKVELRTVKLGRNLGTEFEVLKGLTVSDTVINSPPDSLSSGEVVKLAKDAQPSRSCGNPKQNSPALLHRLSQSSTLVLWNKRMRVRNPGCAVVLCRSLAGCAVGPDYQTPDAALPAAFLTQPAIKEPASGGASPDLWQWWRTLHDPQLNEPHRSRAAEQSRSQDRAGSFAAGEIAARRHRQPGAARSQRRGRRWRRHRDGRNQRPGRAGAERRQTTAQVSRASTGVGGLDAEWEIDMFGKIARRVEAQTYTAEALKEARDWVYVVIAADVSRLYFDLRARQDRLQILNREIEAARKILDLAQTRLDRGLTNELDVTARQASGRNAGGRRRAPQGADRRPAATRSPCWWANTRRRLLATCGGPAAVPRLPARAPVGLPVDLLRRRPDIREAEQFLAAAVADVGARTADLFPSLVITAAGGAQGGPRSGSGIPITWIGSVGPSINAPILDFGALDASIEIADYRAHELATAYKQTILVAVQQVDEANATYHGYRQSLRSLDIAIDAARQATKVATERYDRGLTDFLNVLDAERQQFALEQQRAEVIRLAGDSFVTLYKALGGGWPPDEIIPPIRHPDPAAIAAVKRLHPGSAASAASSATARA